MLGGMKIVRFVFVSVGMYISTLKFGGGGVILIGKNKVPLQLNRLFSFSWAHVARETQNQTKTIKQLYLSFAPGWEHHNIVFMFPGARAAIRLLFSSLCNYVQNENPG